MVERQPLKRYYYVVIATAIIATIGFVVFYDGLPWDNWLQFLILSALMLYAHTYSVNIGKKMSFSLSTVTIFPLIFLYGAAPAMIMAAVSGLLDGLMRKKSWDRTLFNMSQLALCSLAASVVFQLIAGSLDPLDARGVVGMGVAALVFIITNITVVTYVISLFSGNKWSERIAVVGFSGFYSSLGTSFMGLLFTLFVLSYRFWGLLAFGFLLVHFSELLKATAAVSGEREKRRELEEELVIDELTQAYNFKYLHNWLNSSTDERVALLFVDIDNFKAFNDNYGHAEGDQVLKIMTKTLKSSVRANDKVIRYGGDEFVVILHDQDCAGAQEVARRIQENLRKVTFATHRNITTSIGIATMPNDTTDKRELVLLADQAMYAAKDAGKNTFCLHYLEEGPA